MKKSSLVATFVASLLAVNCLPSVAEAQQPPRPAGGAIAIIDVGYIFKYHTRLQTLATDLQRDIQMAEKELTEHRESMRKLGERLEEYKKGTPEYKSLEEELVKRNADIQLQINMQKRGFVEQQAKIFYSIYREVADEVKSYAEANGITLVLRFNGDPADVNDPEEVFKDLNKTVVYYQPTIDITPTILRNLNARMGPASTAPAAQPAAISPGPASRPGIPPRR